MRRNLLLILTVICVNLSAQIPYFASLPAKGDVCGYTSLSVYTADSYLCSYTYLQYGITDNVTAAMHVETFGNGVCWGPELLGGYSVNNYFSFALHALPSFDLTDKFKFSFANIGLYMEGAILPQRQLFWLTNTYSCIYRDASTMWSQYWYLGSYIPLKGEHSLTPMVGCSHSWRFESNPDISIGLLYHYKYWDFMAWCSEIISCQPFVTAAVSFCVPTKSNE